MYSPLTKAVALTLLVVQVLFASMSGRVWCIGAHDCDSHDGTAAGCDRGGHHHHFGSGREHREVQCHEHVFFAGAPHEADDCCCHLHMPIAGEALASIDRRAAGFETRTFLVPMSFVVCKAGDSAPRIAVPGRFRPPDFSGSDQMLALKTSRLMI